MRRTIVIIICLLSSLATSISIAQAQPTPLVLVCVIPDNPDNGTSYVIVFRKSNLFGLILPISAKVTVFSDQNVIVSSHLVTTDAPTGGYRVGSEVALLKTNVENRSNSADCNDDVKQLSKALGISVNQNTFPVPLSPQYGLIFQVGSEVKSSDEYLGVYGIQLRSSVGALTNFQVVQISPSDPFIEISVSKVTAEEPASFMIVGNKSFDVRKSGLVEPDTFGTAVVAEDLEYLIGQLPGKMPLLFETIKNAGMTIYPSHILGHPDPLMFYGGYLQVRADTSQAKRKDDFVPDAKVVPILPGMVATLYLPDRPGVPFNQLTNEDPRPVIRVDDHGQLFVKSEDDKEVIVEAWRVKVISPPAQPAQ